MSFSKLLEKIFKNSGAGPSLSDDVTTELVHKTGDEEIDGVKTLINQKIVDDQPNTLLNFKLSGVSRGSNISVSNFGAVAFKDNNSKNLGFVEYAYRKDSSETEANSLVDLKLGVFERKATDDATWVHIAVGIDENNHGYCRAVSTRLDRADYGNDILTRDWIPKDTRIVHTTGDETISGTKTFINTITKKSVDIERGVVPNSSTYSTIRYYDANDKSMASVQYTARSTSDDSFGYSRCELKMAVHPFQSADATDSAYLTVGYDKDGIKNATAPSTSSTRTFGRDILTRDWIPNDTRIVHTTGDENIYGKKYFCGDSNSFTHFLRIKNNKMDRNGSVSNNAGSSFNLVDKDSDDIASFGINQYTDGDIVAYMHAYNSSGSYISVGLTYVNNAFYPQTTKVLKLGISSKLWTTVYAQTGTINTSDERQKSNIESISDDVLDAWGEINFVKYQLNDSIDEKGEEKARLHSGLVAQRIDEAFKRHNVDASRYGFFCFDKWKAVEEVRDEEGKVVEEATPAGESYSLRYEEALCIEAAYMRRKVSRLESRIAELEKANSAAA